MSKDQSDLRTEQHEHDPHSQLALAWHGFGSPVGLGIFAISLGIAAVLVRVALFGF
ncbi:MAG: hypothetical protein ACXIVF_08995 [Rhizobiaceae bacterium]